MMIASELSVSASVHLFAAIDSFCPYSAFPFESQNFNSLYDSADELSDRFRPWIASLLGGFLAGVLLMSLPVRELLAKRRQLWAERPRTAQQAAQLRQLLRRVGRQYRFVVCLQVALVATAMLAKMIQCSCGFGLQSQGFVVPWLWILALETISVLLIHLQLRYPSLRGRVLNLFYRNRWYWQRIARAKPVSGIAQYGG